MSRAILLTPIPRFDVRKAEVHGTVTYLFQSSAEIPIFGGQSSLMKMIQALEKIEYDAKTDFIVQTGQIALVSMMTLAASECSSDGSVRILIFDARDNSYRARSLDPVGVPKEE